VIAATWNSLEVVKLIVGAMIPVAIFGAGLVLARETRRYEERRWVRQQQFEARLERWSKVGPLLNDLFCFFTLVGHFRSAVALKRELDRLVHADAHILGPSFMDRYYTFMSTCFQTYVGAGVDAQLRASVSRQRMERANAAWDPAWDSLFVPEEEAVPLTHVTEAYAALAVTFQEL
jgi:hypothetical protein